MTKNIETLRKTRRSLPIALLRAREAVMGPVRGILSQSGVNEQKWRVLRVLHEHGPLDQSRVATEACLLVPSLTRMVKVMAAEGLLSRHTPADDRRKTILQISDAGVALIHRHSRQSAELFDRIETEFGGEKLEQLLDLLEELQRMNLGAGDLDNP